MARSSTTYKEGQSGNPKGRPRRDRALTKILEAGGSKTLEVDGKPISGRRLIARLVWEVVTTGQVKFPDGAQYKCRDSGDWFTVVKWLYSHIDGGPLLTEPEEDDDEPTGADNILSRLPPEEYKIVKEIIEKHSDPDP